MNEQVKDNFHKIKLWHFALAVGICALVFGALSIFRLSEPKAYAQANKGLFLALNSFFSNAPVLTHNLTQLGDASVSLAFLLCFALIAPKLWEALAAGSLLCLALTHYLKALYAMPRPARAFGEDTFNIIGQTLKGSNSLPSGHTAAIFTILSICFIAFVPSAGKGRFALAFGIVFLALFVGLSRVGVGAHYPLDVLAGGLLGFVCGLFGVLVASRTRIFAWLNSHHGLLAFALLCALGVVMMAKNLSKENLFIFYPALFCALICLFVILGKYFKGVNSALIFIFAMSALVVVFFHFPLLEFVRANLSLDSLGALVLFASLGVFLFGITLLMPLLLGLVSFGLVKAWFVLNFIANSVAVYFVATYGVFLDKTMMGNLFNTNLAEAGEFLSFKIALWVLVLGIAPACFVLTQKVAKPTRKALLKFSTLTILVLILLAGLNFKNLLWFDKHSKQLGALVMPYSYTINSVRFFQGEFAKNKKEILLPNATIKDDKKALIVLVIGESARAKNFSLYGYARETNPLLKQTPNLRRFYAKSSTTYTTASVKNMLSHKDSGDLYEILPNYLSRSGVSVIWRQSNWGAPPLHLPSVMGYSQLAQKYPNLNDGYESAIIAGLSEEIKAAKSPKVLVVLHTSTSHGPTYHKKYPPKFEKFTPACKSVEPKGCSQAELINAYDNTILYTDFLLHALIEQISALQGYESAMIYASDHGESLGENGAYMHGIPMAFAPKEQFEIPFLVWGLRGVKDLDEVSHFHIFHSVLAFLGVESAVFDEGLNIFKP